MKKISKAGRYAIQVLSFLFLSGGFSWVVASKIDAEPPTLVIPRQADKTWTQEHESNNMVVYSRAVAKNVMREVMAESAIEAPPWQVLSALLDYPAYPSFMPYVVKNEIEKTHENKTWLFQQLDLPWPISDRYYTLVMSHRDDPHHENSYEIRWDLSDEESAQQGKGMQMILNRGGWRLVSANAGQSTKILYYLNADPGGALPSWLNNMANTVAVPKVIEAVRERVQTTSYPPPP